MANTIFFDYILGKVRLNTSGGSGAGSNTKKIFQTAATSSFTGSIVETAVFTAPITGGVINALTNLQMFLSFKRENTLGSIVWAAYLSDTGSFAGKPQIFKYTQPTNIPTISTMRNYRVKTLTSLSFFPGNYAYWTDVDSVNTTGYANTLTIPTLSAATNLIITCALSNTGDNAIFDGGWMVNVY